MLLFFCIRGVITSYCSCDFGTPPILSETRPDFVDSNSDLSEMFMIDPMSDRIFSDNYEFFVHLNQPFVDQEAAEK